MPATFAEAIQDDRVEFDELHGRYGPMLEMVNLLIGVVPYCDRYLEIWEPGFRTYNLIVPSFLDLPNSMFGVAGPKDLVGLGMYASSRAADCSYCTAHTCSFALRRGSTVDAVQGQDRSPQETATVTVAESLGSDPHRYHPSLGAELRRACGDSDAEWVVMGIAMMGFLNKFMDAIGVELEQDAVDDVSGVLAPTGWGLGRAAWAGVELPDQAEATSRPTPPKDSLMTMARLVRHAPGAVKLSRAWVTGLPRKTPELRPHIAGIYGWDEQLLTLLSHDKPMKALGAVLRHNLDPYQSELGIGTKALMGMVYASYVGNTYLVDRCTQLADHVGVDEASLEVAKGFFPGMTKATQVDDRTLAALTLARAMSPSPAVVDADTVVGATAAFSPAEIVEAAVWLSVNQLQHRLSLYTELAR